VDSTTTTHLGVIVSYNSPPAITLTLNKKTITLGDTLYIALKASNQRRINGTLDLGDSTLVYFSNLRNIDTTISHVYSKVGWYFMKANFSNGDSSSEATAQVTVNRYFSMNLKVGMSWKYYYEYFSGFPTEADKSQKGIHEWKVISLSVAEQDTTFKIEETRNDTVHIKGWTVHGNIDTTYLITKISRFAVIQSYNRTIFNIPLLSGFVTFTIPNNTYISSYPYSWQEDGGATFDENGLIGYYRTSQGGLLSSHEMLSRIEYTKP
jgi:hypothetical protein